MIQQIRESYELLIDLSNQLTINYHVDDFQDWAYVYSDPDRLKEFMEFFENNYQNLHPQQIEAMTELILDSANGFLLKHHTLKNPSKNEFLTFIEKYQGDFNHVLSYWKNALENSEFPISKMLINFYKA